MSRWLPWLVTLAVACGEPPTPAPAPATAKPEAAKPEPAPTEPAADATAKAPPKRAPKKAEDTHTFEAQLAALDRQIAGFTKVAENNGKSSLAYGRVASLVLDRARLSGSWDDYARAEQLIDKAFEVSPRGKTGPFMVRAQLNYTLHRLDRVDADFQADGVLPTRDSDTLFRRELFAANLEFQRGQYEAAKRDLEAAVARRPSLSALASLALYHWKAGQFDEAEALYQRALSEYDGDATEPAAWLHLQLGLMDLDRGRWDEALAHYREGEALIRGYWLIEEHIAEILTLQGKTDEAIAMYEAIVSRTDNPEFMDALAEIHEAAGRHEQAATWLAKAGERFESQLARFPEAAYGHALEHFLAHGDDPARTVQLAENNHALRPNADAKRMLAEAYHLAGRHEDARRIIEEALATPMRSADLHATAAAIYGALGQDAKAEEHRSAARAINPRIETS